MRFLPSLALADAPRLRELAAWYRAMAERAGNPAIWERRLLAAVDLEEETARIERAVICNSSRGFDG